MIAQLKVADGLKYPLEESLMSETITWLHLSDLHLCQPETGWDADGVLQALKKDFHNVEKRHGLQPDLIFFTGDAAYGHLGDEDGKSIASQYRDVAVLFDEIRTAFSQEVPRERVFVVPGNHDVNRLQILKGTTALLDTLHDEEDGLAHVEQMIKVGSGNKDWKAAIERLADYRTFLEDAGYNHLLQDAERLVYAVVCDVLGTKVGIAGLNSAWSCGRKKERGKICE